MTKSTPAPDAVRPTLEARFPKLNDHLIRMASSGQTGSLSEWGDFINCIHEAAAPAPATARGGVYVASRASIPERGQMWRDLRSAGVPINSTWIDEDGPKASRDLTDLWVRINREVAASERLVLYVEPEDFPMKGAFIEVGMALATGVPIVVVAPGLELDPRNCRPLGSWIKHPLVSFADTVELALAALASQPQATGGAVERERIARVVSVGLSMFEEGREAGAASYITDAILAILATQPAPSPGVDHADIAARLHPALFSSDERTAHMAASPYAVSIKRAEAVAEVERVLAAASTLSALPAAPSIQKGDEK